MTGESLLFLHSAVIFRLAAWTYIAASPAINESGHQIALVTGVEKPLK